MANVLEKIAAYKREEVAALMAQTSIDDLRARAKDVPDPRGFKAALERVSRTGPALITEVKKASPSKGLIRADFDPVEIARGYASGGAACLSVLTDGPGFMGSNAIFRSVRSATDLPMLRKDFMLEPIQIAESRVMGADAILVILAMVDDGVAVSLMEESERLGMDALVETHDVSEMQRAVRLGATLIGVNNRNLKTFETSLDNFAPLAGQAPDNATLIAESGIFTNADILRLTGEGAQGFLVGESLMRQDNVEAATRALRGLS